MSTALLAAPAASAAPWRRVEQLMGMPVSVALRASHGGVAAPGLWAAAWDRVLAELREVDRVFSTYRPDSWVSRLGRGEVTVEECPPEVAEVLALGERARLASAGAFDVRRGGTLDPSGVVKGWAVQRASAWLGRLPDTDFCLSAGGDLVAHVSGAGPAWAIGVEDPLRPDRLIARVPVRRGAVATSGLHRRGAHVVDGRTGRTPAGIASVTVVSDDLTWADIDATAALAHGPEALAWLRTRAGRHGVVVWADGTAERF